MRTPPRGTAGRNRYFECCYAPRRHLFTGAGVESRPLLGSARKRYVREARCTLIIVTEPAASGRHVISPPVITLVRIVRRTCAPPLITQGAMTVKMPISVAAQARAW